MKSNRNISSMSISIVGGTGRMGMLLAQILKAKVETLHIVSRNVGRAKEAAKELNVSWLPLEEAHQSNIIIVSVPIQETVKICKSIGQKMNQQSLLVELASLKTGITEAIKNSIPNSVEYLSLHPLFGPQVKNIAGKRFVAIEPASGSLTTEFLEMLQECGAVIKKATVKEHDLAMASIQVLHHFALITFSSALSRFTEANGLSEYLTESLEKTLQNIQNIHENWDTIYTIQSLNPNAQKAREILAEVTRESIDVRNIAKEPLHQTITLLRKPSKK
ncbi:MAG: prephenate dehydrogenase/arogenate dehydrogenase family protein [Candidatus Bathyarchaeia archaeon]|nr:prephenate dehydrogenase/arogenate dehydrogenase family protein [Candidatus Bathyarchaeota archaeon]